MKPALYIVCGQVGAGKTTVAKKLSRQLKCPLASVDTTIQSLFPQPSFLGKDQPPSRKELAACYNAFAWLASYLLKNKVSIIIDGAFALRSQRKQLIDVAKKQSVKYYILQIHCPDDILKIRTEKRFKEGRGVGFKAHLKIKKIYEPLMEQHYTIDTAKNVNLQLKKFLYSIR
jgi:predicted kinase